jgi:hypothetical protein
LLAGSPTRQQKISASICRLNYRAVDSTTRVYHPSPRIMIETPMKAGCLCKIEHMEEKNLEETGPRRLDKTIKFSFLTAAAKTRGAPHDATFRVRNPVVAPLI